MPTNLPRNKSLAKKADSRHPALRSIKLSLIEGGQDLPTSTGTAEIILNLHDVDPVL